MEISSVCQCILRKREERIALRLGFLHRRDDETAGIRAAKINAARLEWIE